jgi:hypothetical protein
MQEQAARLQDFGHDAQHFIPIGDVLEHAETDDLVELIPPEAGGFERRAEVFDVVRACVGRGARASTDNLGG